MPRFGGRFSKSMHSDLHALYYGPAHGADGTCADGLAEAGAPRGGAGSGQVRLPLPPFSPLHGS